MSGKARIADTFAMPMPFGPRIMIPAVMITETEIWAIARGTICS
jgi:hypothetical protein